MKKLIYMMLLAVLAAFAQPSPPPQNADFQYLFGSGSGFKPYQTTIKAGAYGFVEGGMKPTNGVYSFVRVDLFSTYAVMMGEGCKQIHSVPYSLLMLCGGLGFGADANNMGAAFDGGGKWFFAPKALRDKDAWVGIEVGVQKSSVPAPVQGSTVISAVQPDFRIGLHKFFR